MTDTYDDCTIYAGPAQISGWGHSDTGGMWFRCRLPGNLSDKPHPFRGYSGKQCQIAVVLCDDNGEPQKLAVGGASTPQSGPANAEGEPHDKPRAHFKDLPKSQQAAIKCHNPVFAEWFYETHPQDNLIISGSDSETCDSMLKQFLHIRSKKELDTDPAAGERWSRLLTDYELKDIAK